MHTFLNAYRTAGAAMTCLAALCFSLVAAAPALAADAAPSQASASVPAQAGQPDSRAGLASSGIPPNGPDRR